MPAPPACEKTTIGQLLAQVRFLSSASPAAIDALAEAAVCLRYTEGETISLEGEPTAGLFVVEQGIVKISRVSLEGREFIMHLNEPGDTFNDVSTLDGGPNPANAVAHTAAVLWRIGRSDLKRLAFVYPDFAWALIEDLAARARVAVGLVHDLAMRSVRGRLARLLLDEAEHTQSGIVERLLTQEQMAARLGTVREMVGRTLRSMANDGLIEFDRHRIVILDPQRLAEEAEI
jgi:CRP/FNR family transcriptional regulator